MGSGSGRVAREWSLADDNVDKLLELQRASQKLVTVAYLLQAMPEPSTTKGRNLHDEAKVLTEQAAVQQAESSASRMRSAASKARGGAHQGREASVPAPQEVKGKAAAADDSRVPSVH